MKTLEIKVNGEVLEVYDPSEIDIAITYSLADILFPSGRNGAFSKTIEIPATKINNQILGHLYDIQSSDSGFVETQENGCEILMNSMRIMNGYIIVNEVINRERDSFYRVNVFSDNSNLFQLLGENKIADLPFSSHVYDETVIEDSWDNVGNVDEYTYPAINYNASLVNNTNVKVEQFKSAVFVR